MKTLKVLLTLIAVLILLAPTVRASEQEAGASAILVANSKNMIMNRISHRDIAQDYATKSV